MSQQCVLPIQKARLILEGDSARVTPPGLLHQGLGSSTQDVNLQEWVQRRARMMVGGLDHFSYEDRLRELMLFTLEKTRLQRSLTADFPGLKGAYKKDGEERRGERRGEERRGEERRGEERRGEERRGEEREERRGEERRGEERREEGEERRGEERRERGEERERRGEERRGEETLS
ncbi:hypothetical protein DUI87_09815 [Hirundo rustica rustica]|uniref:Uncharacterized protein n=1 Tax=Hirundo rustica rustica TaxID=333673 RepID=A0A3M0KGJ0_HIRRU|nr:hypothetical protein DUI87_09815 [Hirundo rustica rustica]